MYGMIKETILSTLTTVKGKKKAAIPPAKKMAAPLRIPITEIFTPCCVGHATAPYDEVDNSPLVVHDFIVDSSGLSGGGESVNPLMQVSLNRSRQIVYVISPEACKTRFKVAKPAGVKKGFFGISFGRRSVRWAAGGDGFYDILPAIVEFEGLEGTAPVITYQRFFISNGTNNSYGIYVTGKFTKNFSFTRIKIKCNYPPRNVQPVIEFYRLESYATPITLTTNDNVCFALFGYTSPNGQDLGPIISIV
jgi:hypothetical protein